ncbi:MAG: alpha-mannosidase [Acidobacteriota bacterium]
MSSKLARPAAARACAAVLVIAAGAFAVRATAQTEVERARVAKQVARVAGKLPASSQNVITRLTLLGDLPAGSWKMHPGDIAHAEASSLDESGWTELKPPAKAPNDAIWLRQTFTVPDTLDGYNLTGARIWFQLHAYANGPMPEILYFNGRRVALGEDLEPVVLFDNAKPGDKVVVAVKLLHTVDTKTIAGATLAIDFPENRPNPEDLRVEFLSSAQLIPTLASAAQVDSDMGTLNAAISAVDLNALDAHDQQKFDASLKAAQSKLEALLPLMQTMTWHLTGNSHIDAAWLWPWTETVDVVKRTFGTALQLMYEYPNYTYTQSAAAYNEWVADKYPDMNDQIKQRIKEGRWEVVGGMWVEPDLNMPGGESLVRQILVGKRWYQQHYGVDVRIGWNPDSFGYTWQLPQIYKKSGIDYFVTQKMTWNDTNQLPFKLFWWESPDGSKVLTYFPHDYANDNLSPIRLAADTVQARLRAPGMTRMMDLYGIGDHGGGPTRAMLDQGEHWSEPSMPAKVVPQMPFGTAETYLQSVEQDLAPHSKTWNYQSIAKGYTYPTPVPGKISIPTWDTEMYLEYHRGVYTTQANHKANMRHSEEEMLNTEKWASLAWVLAGRAYPSDDLTEDWKKVLFNQFHDLAAGSGIGVIYKDAQQDYDWVRMSTNDISRKSLDRVDQNINTQGAGIPVIVYNPLGWPRSGDIKVRVQTQADKTTEVSLHVNNIPALGYKVVRIPGSGRSATATVRAHDNGDSITLSGGLPNDLSVTVSKSTGCITSLKNGDRAGFEYLQAGACGNQLQFFKDNPKDYDAWNIDPGTYDVAPMTIAKADSVESVKLANGEPAVKVTYTFQNSKFVQTITLKGDIVDVGNQIDWHESHILLKAAFPLAATGPFATYEIPYGSIQRPTTRNNSWEKAQFEVPAERWADLGDGKHGLSVLNQTKYGYDAVGNLLRLTLLRSPKWPDPNADMGHHHFHYALYPHAGTWQQALTVRHGWEYNYPLKAVVTTAHAGSLPAEHSFASVDPDNVVLTAVKKAEDANGLILRVYEWAGKSATVSFHVPPGATGATVTNLMEKPEGQPLQVNGDVVKAPIKPYEILTIRVDYPDKTQSATR